MAFAMRSANKISLLFPAEVREASGFFGIRATSAPCHWAGAQTLRPILIARGSGMAATSRGAALSNSGGTREGPTAFPGTARRNWSARSIAPTRAAA